MKLIASLLKILQSITSWPPGADSPKELIKVQVHNQSESLWQDTRISFNKSLQVIPLCSRDRWPQSAVWLYIPLLHYIPLYPIATASVATPLSNNLMGVSSPLLHLLILLVTRASSEFLFTHTHIYIYTYIHVYMYIIHTIDIKLDIIIFSKSLHFQFQIQFCQHL